MHVETPFQKETFELFSFYNLISDPLSERPGRLIAVNLAPVPSPQLSSNNLNIILT